MFNNEKGKITKLFNSLSKNDEFELMFNNYRSDNKLELKKYIDALKYLKWSSDNNGYEIVNTNSLDISYNYENNSVYRVSINGNDRINEFIGGMYSYTNNIIFSLCFTEFLEDDNFTFINKIKDQNRIINIDDYNVRFRVSSENEIDKKELNKLGNLPFSACENIIYRYKNRVSLKLLDTDKEKMNIDLTLVKTSRNITNIMSGNISYELEIDYMTNKKVSNTSMDLLLKEGEKIKQLLDESNTIARLSELEQVKQEYLKLVYGKNIKDKVYTMQPISANISDIISKIPNGYSVTDKADGQKFSMFIINNSIYMISNKFEIKKMGDSIDGFDGTLIEGELIHLNSVNKYVFMMFDTLFIRGNDVRDNILKDRLSYLVEVSNVLSSSNFSYNEYSSKKGYSIKDEKKFYQNEIEKFYEKLNGLIKKQKNNGIVYYPKLFMFPVGFSQSEVFMFSHLIWYNCMENERVNCPYVLDGVIYTGIEQKYTAIVQDTKLPILKYKPPDTNSVDVKIVFKKDNKGEYYNIFDNTIGDDGNKVYRIVNFYVADRNDTETLFMEGENNHEAFMPLIKGHIRDIEGNIIKDGTIVEITYNDMVDIPHEYRWLILRTRWDKVKGNFKTFAENIWLSMKQSVTLNEIKSLADPSSYSIQQNQLSVKLSKVKKNIKIESDVYYKVQEKGTEKMRKYHNFIKTHIINTFCSEYSETVNGELRKNRVLDLGIGSGGDLEKYWHARIGELVGIDVDYDGLFTIPGNANDRINKIMERYKFKERTNYTLIHAYADLLLNEVEQKKILPNMSNENLENIRKCFSKKNSFDLISSQFALHYMFKDDNTIQNLIDNIGNNLRLGGYFICTLFDGDLVMNLLKDKSKYISYYTDDNGNKTSYFEIVKKFDREYDGGVGYKIDVLMPWINDKYIEEPLVSKRLLIKTMRKAGCRLVETETFGNLFEMNREFFTKSYMNEENEKNRKVYRDISDFYGELEGKDKESKVYSFLNRYYIFKKFE